jgi:hypothetical protein
MGDARDSEDGRRYCGFLIVPYHGPSLEWTWLNLIICMDAVQARLKAQSIAFRLEMR